MVPLPCSDLLGDYEFDVELDYDENMDELEASRAETPKLAEEGMLCDAHITLSQPTALCYQVTKLSLWTLTQYLTQVRLPPHHLYHHLQKRRVS